ncbi:MAG: DNA mismatch repair endonuclease MutL [Myxococcota bacterium]
MPTAEIEDPGVAGPPRIERLGSALADQIAAGEVVERPASVVKELLENSIDAGSRRVRIELQDAGVASIVVIDDGHGIRPDDLELAVTRHATSKVRQPEDLVEISTLGFRGEALASMAAVAYLRICSRTRDSDRGTELTCRPGLPPERGTVGMPVGTRIEIRNLFGNVPARRKFLRSEATELGHITQTVLRVGLVQPHVSLSVQHGHRRLLELSSGSAAHRVEQVLARGHRGPLRHVQGEHDGIGVEAWMAPADASLRNRSGLHVVVRQRVVREPNIARIVAASYGETMPGRHPVAVVMVEPPHGQVDVNVHPQKAEIRFGEPQRVYAAVRAVLGRPSDEAATGEAPVEAVAPASASLARPDLSAALDRWAQAAAVPVAREPSPGYRLKTRAASPDYRETRQSLRDEAGVLHQAWRDDRAPDPTAPVVPLPSPPPGTEPTEAETPAPAPDPGPEYLGCLPGPVGLFRAQGDLLAVDLKALRSHLVLLRLKRDIGGGDVSAQGLLAPIVVKLPPADVAQCVAGQGALTKLGLHLEAFGEDAVIVRAVPASLRHCIGEPDVADLVRRVLPWLRVRARSAKGTDAESGAEAWDDAMAAMAQTGAPDPAPRLARRWLRELVEEGAVLEQVPGVVRWTPGALTRSESGRG